MLEPVVYPFHGGKRTIYKRDAMVVRITTDEDLSYAPGPASLEVSDLIMSKIAPCLIERDIFDPKGICRSNGRKNLEI